MILATETEGLSRLFDLDLQLLADAVLMIIAMFVLFLVASHFLFNPVRKMLADRKYTFKVAKTANKIEIKKAVEQLFKDVKVEKVNTMNVRGRKKRMGRNEGYTSDWKKAIVTLKEGSKTIEFFDGMI